MKTKVTLSISLLASFILLSLLIYSRTAEGQTSYELSGPTGTPMITLGSNQILRITAVNAPGQSGNNRNARLQFRRIEYEQQACNGPICKTAVAGQNTSDVITLMPGEGASFDIPNTAFGIRGLVISNSRDLHLSAHIIDTTTGQVEAIIAILVG